MKFTLTILAIIVLHGSVTSARRLKLDDKDPIFEHQRTLHEECATAWDCICDGDSGLGTEASIQLSPPGEMSTDTSLSASQDGNAYYGSVVHDDGHEHEDVVSLVHYEMSGLSGMECGIGECGIHIHG